MEWFGDAPALDIAKGDRNSQSKRGLIGIGWKKMRNGTSVHANFNAESVDSIVVISADNGAVPSINLEERTPMASFTLMLERATDVAPQSLHAPKQVPRGSQTKSLAVSVSETFGVSQTTEL